MHTYFEKGKRRLKWNCEINITTPTSCFPQQVVVIIFSSVFPFSSYRPIYSLNTKRAHECCISLSFEFTTLLVPSCLASQNSFPQYGYLDWCSWSNLIVAIARHDTEQNTNAKFILFTMLIIWVYRIEGKWNDKIYFTLNPISDIL